MVRLILRYVCFRWGYVYQSQWKKCLYNCATMILTLNKSQAAVLMKQRFPDNVEQVYIHLVQPLHKTFGFTSLEECRALNIVFYKTFVGAACHAATHGLITHNGLLRICPSALADFEDITRFSDARREEARLELKTDLEKARMILNKKVPFPLATNNMPLGSSVVTQCFGTGYIRNFDNITGIYQVVLTELGGDRMILGYFPHSDLMDPLQVGSSFQSRMYKGGRPGSLKGLVDVVEEEKGEVGGKDKAPYSSLRSPDSNGGQVSKLDTSPSVSSSTPRYPKGSLVRTPYGVGEVKRYRKHDQIYHIQLTGFNARAFLQEKDLLSPRVKPQSKRSLRRFMRHFLALSHGDLQGATIGSYVQTAYGPGIVKAYSQQGCFEVRLSGWGGTAYLQESEFVCLQESEFVYSDATHQTLSPSIQGISSTMLNLLPKFGSRLPEKHAYLVDEEVDTLYGRGTVEKPLTLSRSTLKVRLEWGGTLFVPQDSLVDTLHDMSAPSPGIGSAGLRMVSFLTRRENAVDEEVAFVAGQEVSTPYGRAHVLSVVPSFFSPSEGHQKGTIKVEFVGWEGVGYLQEDQVAPKSSPLFAPSVPDKGIGSTILSLVLTGMEKVRERSTDLVIMASPGVLKDKLPSSANTSK